MLPTIVLLPGMDGTGEFFHPFLSAAKDEFRTIIVRYPTDRALAYSQLVSFVASHLPNDAPFVLLAESFSGPVAISLAAGKPDGLVGLILCATFAQNPRPRLRFLVPLLELIPLRWLPDPVLTLLFFGRFATPALVGELKQILAKVDDAVLHQRLRALLDVDVTDELKRIDMPSLYITAREDRLIPSKATRPFQQLSPKWQITEITGPHLLMQSVPRDVVRAVRNFLESFG